MSTPFPESQQPPTETRGVNAEALFADLDGTPLEVRTNTLSTLERGLRESLDTPGQS